MSSDVGKAMADAMLSLQQSDLLVDEEVLIGPKCPLEALHGRRGIVVEVAASKCFATIRSPDAPDLPPVLVPTSWLVRATTRH